MIEQCEGKLVAPKLYEPIHNHRSQSLITGCRCATGTTKKVASVSMQLGSSPFQRNIKQLCRDDFFNQSIEHNEKAFNSILIRLPNTILVIIDLHAMIRAAQKIIMLPKRLVGLSIPFGKNQGGALRFGIPCA